MIEGLLREALQMTSAVLHGAVTPEAVSQLLTDRAPLIEAAVSQREQGVGWGETEAALAQRIMSADRKLVQALWAPRGDAFRWLVERDDRVVVDMPHLSALA